MRHFAKILLYAVCATAADKKTIAVDGWHNNEQQPHYRWDGSYPGGFSQLGDVLQKLGGELKTIAEPLTAGNLKRVDCLIVVDPDTPTETETPHYFAADEIAAIEKWVKAGGTLVLLGNDKGNAEFVHFNQLAMKFGVQFVEGKYVNPQGVSKVHLKSNHAVFAGDLDFYAVDLAPLKISAHKPEILLADNGIDLMARVKHGKGSVLALGDPWLYNEYINTGNNRQIGENLFRYLLWK